MTRFIDAVARLTAGRQREQLERTLIEVAEELLAPRRLRLWEISDRDGEPHALCLGTGRAEGDGTATCDAIVRLARQPRLGECVRGAQVVRAPCLEDDACHVTFIPFVENARASCVVEVHSVRPLSQYSERLLAGLLQIYRNQAQLIEESEYDALTGLLNRRSFDKQLASAPSMPRVVPRTERRAARTGEGAQWLAVIDLDRFKAINDRFGHLYGDEVLVLFSRLLHLNLREADSFYRFGGEEFIVTIPSAAPSEALNIFERFRQEVADFQFPQVGRVTVSIGYTRVEGREPGPLCFGRADKALYFAKTHGRNQVHCYEDLLARKLIEVLLPADARIDFF